VLQFCLQSTGRTPIKILTQKTENFCKISSGCKCKLPRRHQVCECCLSSKMAVFPGGPINVMKGWTDNATKGFILETCSIGRQNETQRNIWLQIKAILFESEMTRNSYKILKAAIAYLHAVLEQWRSLETMQNHLESINSLSNLFCRK